VFRECGGARVAVSNPYGDVEHRPLAERIRWGNVARLGFVVVAAGAVMWVTADGGGPARLPADVGVVRPRPRVPPPRSLPARPPPPTAARRPPRRHRSRRRHPRRRAAITRRDRPPVTPLAAPPPVYASDAQAAPSPEFSP